MKEFHERQEDFLKELTKLSLKHKIQVGGCGCCGSPFLADEAKTKSLEYFKYYYGNYLELKDSRK